MSVSRSRARHLFDLLPDDGPLAEIIRERADHILAKDGGRQCERPLTDAEIDSLLAGDDSRTRRDRGLMPAPEPDSERSRRSTNERSANASSTARWPREMRNAEPQAVYTCDR
jgi:hypothetical protein